MMNNIEMLLQQMDDADTPVKIDETTTTIAKIGESVLPSLFEYTRRIPLRFQRREKAVLVIQKIGFPDNKSAIPFMLDLAADPNSPGWSAATNLLINIGSPIIPDLKSALSYYLDNMKDFSLAFNSLCQLIEQCDKQLQASFLTELDLYRQQKRARKVDSMK